jgi:hypothetical protein
LREEDEVLERILYVSRVAPGAELSNVFEIARASAERNAAEGLSGVLVFIDGWFVQGLEGPVPALCAAYARILRDPRHTELSFRAREPSPHRALGAPGLGLRLGTGLNPALLDRFGYRFGFPVETFPADRLLEFMVWASGPAADTLRGNAAAMRRPASG